MTTPTALLLLAMSVQGPADATSPSQAPAQLTIELCIVNPIDDVEVPAQETGPLIEVLAKEGSLVEPGSLIAQIDDSRAQLAKQTAELKRDVAKMRAADDVEVKIAEATHGVANEELQARLKIQSTISASEIRRLTLARDSAKFEIDKARRDVNIDKMTADAEQLAVHAAEQEIERRKIISPIKGEVVTLLQQKGEWVAAGTPVARVVRMDLLNVEGMISVRDYNPGEVLGKPVAVVVELARGRRVQLPGRVTHVSPLVKAGTKYRVRAEVQNHAEQGQWILRPGSAVSMTVGLR